MQRLRDLFFITMSAIALLFHYPVSRLTPRVGGAPEHNWTVLVLFGPKDVVELDGEPVKVSNVQRAKVMMESIVQELIIDGEIAWRCLVGGRRERGRSLSDSSSLRSLLS